MAHGRKTGGRKKGTRNKRSDLAQDMFGKIGFAPVEDILDSLPKLTPAERVRTLIALMPYVFPKIAPIDFADTLSTEERQRLNEELWVRNK